MSDLDALAPGDEVGDRGMLNDDEAILVMVDEAHRSHSNALHANLLQALPNCARIGFHCNSAGDAIPRIQRIKSVRCCSRRTAQYATIDSGLQERSGGRAWARWPCAGRTRW
jgi:hypothetical protein